MCVHTRDRATEENQPWDWQQRCWGLSPHYTGDEPYNNTRTVNNVPNIPAHTKGVGGGAQYAGKGWGTSVLSRIRGIEDHQDTEADNINNGISGFIVNQRKGGLQTNGQCMPWSSVGKLWVKIPIMWF